MVERRTIFIAVIGGLVFAAAAHADMIPVSKLDAGRQQVSCAYGRTDLQYTNLSSPVSCPSVADLGLWSVQLLPKWNPNVRETCEIQHPITLTNGSGSYSLCLFALIGLGLCRSAPFVKRLSFGVVPEWFHDGGPFQIGHSHAVIPESLCPARACCFIQPVWPVQPLISQYRVRTIVSLWRKSQFTSVVLASRGPPIC